MKRFFCAVGAGVGVFAGGTWVVGLALGSQAAAVLSYLAGLLVYLGVLGGAGAIGGWTRGEPAPEGHGHDLARYFSFDADHKVVGVQYLVASMVVFVVAGSMALVMRLELARHSLQFLTYDTYNTILTLHGMGMVVVALIAIIGGFGNYVVPLQVGARDMAFPRMNALSFWLVPPAVLLLLSTPFLGGLDFGWTAYAPLSTQGAGLGKLFFLLAFVTAGFSSIFGGVNFLATVLTMRAPGMGARNIPIFTWSVIAASAIMITGTSVVAASMIMVVFDRVLHTTFFNPALGGSAILFQHLFWFYSHPAVYIMILPAFGAVLEILPAQARKPLFAFPIAAAALILIVILSFIVWAHHMFTSGMWGLLKIPFMVNTELISVPTGVVFLAALGTLWRSSIRFDPPMLWSLAMLLNFLIGGLTGIPLADAPTDLHFHDTWFVVAHFHFTIMGGTIFGFFAAFHYWFPKVSGRMLDGALAKTQAALMFVGFNCVFIPLFWLGGHGMRRRVADFPEWMDPVQTFASLAALVIAASVLLFVYNVWRALSRGEAAGDNPWEAKTLEWATASPPPHGNFKKTPDGSKHPYDYGVPV